MDFICTKKNYETCTFSFIIKQVAFIFTKTYNSKMFCHEFVSQQKMTGKKIILRFKFPV